MEYANKSPKAGIDVTTNIFPLGKFCNFINRIDNAMGIVRCWSKNHDSVVVNQRLHVVDIDLEFVI